MYNHMVGLAVQILEAIDGHYGSRPILEADCNQEQHTLYVETYYCLCQLLLYLLAGQDPARLELAASRLAAWRSRSDGVTFFNAQAVFMTAYLLRCHPVRHEALQGEVDVLLREYEPSAKRAWAHRNGNNVYALQLADDLLYYPLACGRNPSDGDVEAFCQELSRFRSPDGLYYDLPRPSSPGSKLFPFSYCLKFAYLFGTTGHMSGDPRLLDLFRGAMEAIRPLLTVDGNFAYYGRTDNSPFAAGLALFNHRLASSLEPGASEIHSSRAERVEHWLLQHPRTKEGWLQANRFHSPNPEELRWSRDTYAYPTQYSIVGLTFALLAELWMPRSGPASAGATPALRATPASDLPSFGGSADAGVYRLSNVGCDLFVTCEPRLGAEDTRRYCAPSILRYERNGTLLVGAIPMAVSADLQQGRRCRRQPWKLLELLRYRWRHGYENRNVEWAGFLPAIHRGRYVLAPSTLRSFQRDRMEMQFEYSFARAANRGRSPVVEQALRLIQQNTRRRRQHEVVGPKWDPEALLLLSRRVSLGAGSVRIRDTITGTRAGDRIRVVSRFLAPASVTYRGPAASEADHRGWSSDGLCALRSYEFSAIGSTAEYGLEVG